VSAVAVKELCCYPDPVLRRPTAIVDNFNSELSVLLDDLSESMYFHKGVGLAAPQIGLSLRVAVVDVGHQDEAPALVELVNPRVVSVSQDCAVMEEGCLSFPDEQESVSRPQKAVIKAYNRYGEACELEAEGLLARAFLHEIEHLEGKLFIDHLSRLKRSMIERRINKRTRKAMGG
jgi:peptide deformylase